MIRKYCIPSGQERCCLIGSIDRVVLHTSQKILLKSRNDAKVSMSWKRVCGLEGRSSDAKCVQSLLHLFCDLISFLVGRAFISI